MPDTRANATQAELARLLGVSRQAIRKHVASGKLTPDADGRLVIEDARHALAEQVRLSGKTNTAAAQQAALPPQQSSAPAPAAMPAQPGPMSYHLAKTLREATEANIAQIKLQQMQGNLIQRDPATQATFTAFRQLRDALQPLGRNLAPKLAALQSDTHAIEQAITVAVADVLSSFKRKTLPSLAARMGNSADATATIGAMP